MKRSGVRLQTTPAVEYLALEPGLPELGMFLQVLNTSARKSGKNDHKWQDELFRPRFDLAELRRLVDSWIWYGRKVGRLLSAEPALRRAADARTTAHLVPDSLNRRLIYKVLPQNAINLDQVGSTISLFLSFLRNPYNHELVGPCRYCKRYFQSRSSHKRLYCSAKCGRKESANVAIRKRRMEDQAEKLRKAQQSIEAWRRSKPKLDCKNWVAKNTQISKHWLTRAARVQKLAFPKRKA